MREGWKSATISDLASFQSGGTPNKKESSFWGGSTPWVTVKDMKVMRLNGVGESLTTEGAKTVRVVPPGTILVLVRGMGLFKDLPVVLCDREVAFNQDIKALVPNAGVDSEFLATALIARKSDILRHVDSAGHGTGRLDTDLLKSTPLPLPPLPEQRKIAAILRTWDEALEKLNALRAAKERRLRGLGRKMFERAADNPNTVSNPVADLARIIKGRQLNRLDIVSGEYPVWNGGISPSGFHNEWNTEGGTITISEGGSCGFVKLSDRRFWLGGHCYALQDLSSMVDRDFLFHALKLRQAEIMRLRVGSGLPNIQRVDIERLSVTVPPLDVQRRIGEALTTAKHELSLLNERIAALTRQKRGLMQKLLTGAWRVEISDDEEAAA